MVVAEDSFGQTGSKAAPEEMQALVELPSWEVELGLAVGEHFDQTRKLAGHRLASSSAVETVLLVDRTPSWQLTKV